MATRNATVELDAEPRVLKAEHEVGETRRHGWIIFVKLAPGIAATLLVQNVTTLPSWWGFASPVLDVLGITVGA